jgi:long-chain acyl-CoA synthetase
VVAGHDKPACLLHKAGGRYVPISSRELVARIRAVARALEKAGVRPGDRVALMAENGPHWPAIDFACHVLGAVSVPIYPTLLPDAAAYIARDSGARILFVQGEERLSGLLGERRAMSAVELLIAIDVAAPPDGVVTLDQFAAAGADATDAWLEASLRHARPSDLATLIYTSGTTGEPKGVMLTHANLVSNLLTGAEILGVQGDHTALSFLPLSHSFERTVDYTYFYEGVTIAYAESVQTVAENLREVRPHVFVAVPRVYEKVMAKVMEGGRSAGGIKGRIFRWALGVGRDALADRLAGRPAGFRVRLADRLVFSKIRERLGGRFEYALSGGAPLSRDVAEFFWGAGIRIFEGYGLTETSPVISVNVPGAVKLGTVGRPIPGVEVRIADDGEILARGPNIMRGYFGRPEATAEVIGSDGWFHTGDVGHLDADGFLVITDRKKELIVSAYGKNIAPAPIENALKASPFLSQAVVVGDRRQFLAALLVPDFDYLAGWAKERGLPQERGALLASPELRDAIAAEIDALNARHARYEQVREWELLPDELTLEGGELTPTMKVKRRVVAAKYKDVLDRLFAPEAGRSEN